MKINKETNRKVVCLKGYIGTCDGCGNPVEYEEELVLVEIERTGEKAVLVPIDILSCPHCFITISTITYYPPMEITKELANL